MKKYEIKYMYTGNSPDGYIYGEGTIYLYGRFKPTERQARAGVLESVNCSNPKITIQSIEEV